MFSQVTCYDWDNDGSHDLIGVFTTSLSELMEGQRKGTKVCFFLHRRHHRRHRHSKVACIAGRVACSRDCSVRWIEKGVFWDLLYTHHKACC